MWASLWTTATRLSPPCLVYVDRHDLLDCPDRARTPGSATRHPDVRRDFKNPFGEAHSRPRPRVWRLEDRVSARAFGSAPGPGQTSAPGDSTGFQHLCNVA